MSEQIIDTASQNVEPPEAQQSFAAPRRHRVAAAIATLATTAALLEGCSSDHTPPPDTCTSATHDLLETDSDSSWNDLATQATEDTGYHISAVRLKQANVKLIPVIDTPDSKKSGKDEKRCLTLPVGVIAGYEEADGKETVGMIAKNTREPIAVLVKKNPGLKNNAASIPPAGTLINISTAKNPVNYNLFEQKSPYDNLSKIPGWTSHDKIDALLLANDEAVINGDIKKGAMLKLPLIANEHMKKHRITPQQEINAANKYYADPPKVEEGHIKLTKKSQSAIDKMIAQGGHTKNMGLLLQMFMSHSLAPTQSCGAVGNLDEESDLNPTNVQNGFGADSLHFPWNILGKAGYGLAQWTSAWRQKLLVKDANQQGKPAGDFQMQKNHIWKELTGHYPTALQHLRASKTLKQATDIWMTEYEKPGNPNEKRRLQLAQVCLNKFNALYAKSKN